MPGCASAPAMSKCGSSTGCVAIDRGQRASSVGSGMSPLMSMSGRGAASCAGKRSASATASSYVGCVPVFVTCAGGEPLQAASASTPVIAHLMTTFVVAHSWRFSRSHRWKCEQRLLARTRVCRFEPCEELLVGIELGGIRLWCCRMQTCGACGEILDVVRVALRRPDRELERGHDERILCGERAGARGRVDEVVPPEEAGLAGRPVPIRLDERGDLLVPEEIGRAHV